MGKSNLYWQFQFTVTEADQGLPGRRSEGRYIEKGHKGMFWGYILIMIYGI